MNSHVIMWMCSPECLAVSAKEQGAESQRSPAAAAAAAADASDFLQHHHWSWMLPAFPERLQSGSQPQVSSDTALYMHSIMMIIRL